MYISCTYAVQCVLGSVPAFARYGLACDTAYLGVVAPTPMCFTEYVRNIVTDKYEQMLTMKNMSCEKVVEGIEHPNAEALRTGYTTGACAAAGAVAAFAMLMKRKTCELVSLAIPDGEQLAIPIQGVEMRSNCAVAHVMKDAGDDPDVTDKMLISVKVELIPKVLEAPQDYVETCGEGLVIIKGGDGVGLVTRPGLDVLVGKWAINPIPREMIVENLGIAGFGVERAFLNVKILAENGAKIAEHTLNPVLGVKDGISILGTSGIVLPYSNAAYIQTIRIRIRCAVEEGCDLLAFCTGSRTQKAVARDIRELKKEQCVRIGDFIADSLKAANLAGLKSLVVACMPGKLYKYACGHEYTHAHKVKLEPDLMIEELTKLRVSEEILANIAECDTVGEAAAMLNESVYVALLRSLYEKALANIAKWAPNVDIRLHLYDNHGRLYSLRGR